MRTLFLDISFRTSFKYLISFYAENTKHKCLLCVELNGIGNRILHQ
jgi:hypothetical protein